MFLAAMGPWAVPDLRFLLACSAIAYGLAWMSDPILAPMMTRRRSRLSVVMIMLAAGMLGHGWVKAFLPFSGFIAELLRLKYYMFGTVFIAAFVHPFSVASLPKSERPLLE